MRDRDDSRSRLTRLVLGLAELLLDVVLVLLQQLRMQADVARLVDTVDVSEACGDGEVG